MDLNLRLPDGTIANSIRNFFERCLNDIQSQGWQWDSDFCKTKVGVLSSFTASKNDVTHVVVSVDVERMLQEIVRQINITEKQWAMNR